MFKINYTLKKPEQIEPWGESLHWFGLTDSLLWINVGDAVIYEYLKSHPDSMGNEVKYNDYQLSRFLEDLLELSPVVPGSIPKSLYDSIETMDRDLEEWISLYADKSDEEYDLFYDECFVPLSDWFYSRRLDSGHLICGPRIGFFRCGDNMKIIWNGNCMEDGTELWKDPRGVYELPYSEFVSEVSRFVNSFMRDMDKQVEDVVNNGIPDVYVDIDALVRENIKRKDTFDHQLKCFSAENNEETDWDRILELYALMQKELGK